MLREAGHPGRARSDSNWQADRATRLPRCGGGCVPKRARLHDGEPLPRGGEPLRAGSRRRTPLSFPNMSVPLDRAPMSRGPGANLADAYLELLKEHLTRGSHTALELSKGDPLALLYAPVRKLLSRFDLSLVRDIPSESRAEGLQASADAETMIGTKRLDNLQYCVTQAINDGVPGDLIETGVWRGGASIFMRGILLALGDSKRTVWVADSFRGLPKPDSARYPADRGDHLWKLPALAVSLEEVKSNFARYRLLDEQVRFLEGWFSDTLAKAPIDELAVLRLDGDMYESTKDALDALYPKLSVGGYVIVDDYGAIAACRQAVADFRTENRIEDQLRRIDWTGVYWRRQSE